jgi:hypothetical protein
MSIKSSGSLGFDEINNEYSSGTNLNTYRGADHWTSDDKTNKKTFPSEQISFSDFYSTSAGGGGYVVDFTGSSSWNVPINGTCAVLLVAGGGSAGYTTSYYLEGGGGGGAGGCRMSGFDRPLVAGGRVDVSIGGGGSWAGNGNDSSVTCYHPNGSVLWSYYCHGGGHGGAPRSFTAGNGGSGGGGSPWYGRDLRGYTVDGSEGNNGGYGTENATGGGGGGWGGDGGSGYQYHGADGGPGKTVGYYGYNYSVGGGGGSGGNISGNSGAGGLGGGAAPGGNGDQNTGGGAGGGYNSGTPSGGSGRCVIWWSK